MVWYHHGEEDGGGQKWGTPYLDEGWAQRLVPRSTGWKLVVTGGKQTAALLSICSPIRGNCPERQKEN